MVCFKQLKERQIHVLSSIILYYTFVIQQLLKALTSGPCFVQFSQVPLKLCLFMLFLNMLCIHVHVNFLLVTILQSFKCTPLFLKFTDENWGEYINVKFSVLLCLLISVQDNELITCVIILLRYRESRDDALVRALALHQCGLGSKPDDILGSSLLLVLVLTWWVLLWVCQYSSLLKNWHSKFPILWGVPD